MQHTNDEAGQLQYLKTHGFGMTSNPLSIVVGLFVILLGCNSNDRIAPVDELKSQSARIYTLDEIRSYTHVTPVIQRDLQKNRIIVESQVGMVIMNPGSRLGKQQASQLNTMPSLRVLRISSCSLEPDFFNTLAVSDRLEYLYARDTIFSESDLREIAKFKKLKFLDVGKTNVTKEWVEEEIKKSIPGVVVHTGEWTFS